LAFLISSTVYKGCGRVDKSYFLVRLFESELDGQWASGYYVRDADSDPLETEEVDRLEEEAVA